MGSIIIINIDKRLEVNFLLLNLFTMTRKQEQLVIKW